MSRESIRGLCRHRDLAQIYERIMDVMRKIQKEEIAPASQDAVSGTELDAELDD